MKVRDWEGRHMRCPDCGRIASVPEWVVRPICLHTWDGSSPEIWDGADSGMNGEPIELSPNEEYRQPGKWWQDMEELLDFTGED